MSERLSVSVGTSIISFSVIRSTRRRKTITVVLEPSGAIIVRAPADATREQIVRTVRAKTAWILSRLRLQKDDGVSKSGREFVSGESFHYLGRHYRLKILRGGRSDAPRVRLFAGRLEVRLSERVPEQIRSALIRWCSAHALRRLKERVAFYCSKAGMPIPVVLVREQRNRWGSCDAKGTLRFNWRIIMAPLRLVDYVVAHELMHLKYRDHSRRFWHGLGVIMPDYEQRRERLKRTGGSFCF